MERDVEMQVTQARTRETGSSVFLYGVCVALQSKNLHRIYFSTTVTNIRQPLELV
eukprot:SAG11_NODE_10575_length_820_cov_0.858530_1_plen_54_part_01